MTVVDAPRRLAWRGIEASGALLGTSGSYELEAPSPDTTRFRLSIRYEAQGLGGRVQAPILGFVLRRVARRFLRQLKDQVEQEPASAQ